MKRMLLVTAFAVLATATSSGCRMFGGRNGDRCDPCSISHNECGPAPILGGSGGTTILPTPAPTTTNHHVLPGPVEPTS